MLWFYVYNWTFNNTFGLKSCYGNHTTLKFLNVTDSTGCINIFFLNIQKLQIFYINLGLRVFNLFVSRHAWIIFNFICRIRSYLQLFRFLFKTYLKMKMKNNKKHCFKHLKQVYATTAWMTALIFNAP